MKVSLKEQFLCGNTIFVELVWFLIKLDTLTIAKRCKFGLFLENIKPNTYDKLLK